MDNVLEVIKGEDGVLSDGTYIGEWGGYTIEVIAHRKSYKFKTENGVRGSGIKVLVSIKEGVAIFEMVK